MRGTKFGWITVILLAAALVAPTAALAGPSPDLITPQAEAAIRDGLEWLARNQQRSGAWSAGGGRAGYEGAMTGLAGLALLASGSTPTRGPYADNIRRAIHWVLAQQNRATGLIVSRGEESRSMYSHGFCTLFLAEALGTTGSPSLERRIRVALENAIKLIEGSQSRPTEDAGGWIYTPSGASDEGSVTVTQVQALRACQNAGLQVNRAVIDRAFNYLKLTKTADGGIAYSLAQMRGGRGGTSRPALAAAAWTCLNSAGRYNDPLTIAVRDYCLERYRSLIGGRQSFYFYLHLYLAEAMYQHGGEPWRDYFARIREDMLERRNADGSWNGDNIGPTYGTAVALIILQLPNGYMPIVQN